MKLAIVATTIAAGLFATAAFADSSLMIPTTRIDVTDAGGSAASLAAVARLKAAGMETKVVRNMEGPSMGKGKERVEIHTYAPTPGELPGVSGYLFRSSVVNVEPGGIVPLHPHAGRPAYLEVLSGSITQHRSDGQSVLMRPGHITHGADQVAHWWENTGTVPTSIWVVDLCESGEDEGCDPGATTPAVLDPATSTTVPNPPSGAKPLMDEMIRVDLGNEFPGQVDDRVLRLRTVTLPTGHTTKVHQHVGRPNYFRVMAGTISIHTHEGVSQAGPGTVVIEEGPGMRAFSNQGPQTVILRAVDVFEPNDSF